MSGLNLRGWIAQRWTSLSRRIEMLKIRIIVLILPDETKRSGTGDGSTPGSRSPSRTQLRGIGRIAGRKLATGHALLVGKGRAAWTRVSRLGRSLLKPAMLILAVIIVVLAVAQPWKSDPVASTVDAASAASGQDSTGITATPTPDQYPAGYFYPVPGDTSWEGCITYRNEEQRGAVGAVTQIGRCVVHHVVTVTTADEATAQKAANGMTSKGVPAEATGANVTVTLDRACLALNARPVPGPASLVRRWAATCDGREVAAPFTGTLAQVLPAS
jgi:hypothetical protein